jgi:hypothetical protein
MTAAAPETCGAAMDVPESDAYWFVGKVLRIALPGAARPADATYVACVEKSDTAPVLLMDATGTNLPAPAPGPAYAAG